MLFYPSKPRNSQKNHKQISKNNDQNSKPGARFYGLRQEVTFGISNLDIICYLFFGACNFIAHGSNHNLDTNNIF